MLVCPGGFATDKDDLYQQGHQAYIAGNYLAASEHLFAYRQIAGGGISEDFLRQVNEALKYAEDQIQLAVDTKRELDKHGVVTEVIVEASGKADTGATQKKTIQFHHHHRNITPKPGLPAKPVAIPIHKFNANKVVVPIQGVHPTEQKNKK